MSNKPTMSKVIPIRTLPDDPLRSLDTAEAWLAGLDVGKSTLRNYRQALADARTFFTTREITPATMMEYRHHLSARGLANASINTYLSAVKQFCAAHYDDSPAAALRIKRNDRHSRLALSRDQATAILALPCESVGDFRDRAIIALALVCGLRSAEVSRLRLSDYTEEGGHRVMRVQGKGKHDRNQIAVVPASLASIIEAWLKVRPESKWLFCALDRACRGRQLSTRSISGVGRRALDTIGLTDPAYTFHALRHTAACLILEYSDDYAQTQTLLRHASIDTTRIYTHSVARRRRLAKPPEAVISRTLLEGGEDLAAIARDMRAVTERLHTHPVWQNKLTALVEEIENETTQVITG